MGLKKKLKRVFDDHVDRPLDPAGLFEKPKPPEPTASELELERLQSRAINEATRETNARIKGAKRQRSGRRKLLGSARASDDETAGGRSRGTPGGFPGRRGRGGPGAPGQRRGGGGGGGGRGGGGGSRGGGLLGRSSRK